MTTTSAALRRTSTWNRPLMVLVAAMAVLTLITAVGIFADDRVLTGAPIWLKPFKFSVSFALYASTLAWMLSLLPRRSRLAERAAIVIVALFVVEMVVIVAQVIRGQTSHFNETTPLNAALFNVDGRGHHGAVRRPARDRRSRCCASGSRTGSPRPAYGSASACRCSACWPRCRWCCPPPSPALAGISGAHSVGVPDGGPGLPVVGWSTTGGDLRVGHFVGLHALQALPILALLLIRFGGRLGRTHQGRAAARGRRRVRRTDRAADLAGAARPAAAPPGRGHADRRGRAWPSRRPPPPWLVAGAAATPPDDLALAA